MWVNWVMRGVWLAWPVLFFVLPCECCCPRACKEVRFFIVGVWGTFVGVWLATEILGSASIMAGLWACRDTVDNVFFGLLTWSDPWWKYIVFAGVIAVVHHAVVAVHLASEAANPPARPPSFRWSRLRG